MTKRARPTDKWLASMLARVMTGKPMGAREAEPVLLELIERREAEKPKGKGD